MSRKFLLLVLLVQILGVSPVFAQNHTGIATKYQALSWLFDHFGIQIKAEYQGATPAFKQHWRDVWPANPSYGLVNTACEIGLLRCAAEQFFDGESSIATTAFLKMFYTLKWQGPGNTLTEKLQPYQNTVWYMPYWQEAVSANLMDRDLSLDALSEVAAREFLRRDKILSEYGGFLPTYFPGLESDPSLITTASYYQLETVQKIIQDYYQGISRLTVQKQTANPATQKNLTTALDRLYQMQKAFIALRELIQQNPLLYDPGVPQVIKDNIYTLGIQEKIGESVYDFSGSPAYRKYNIKEALKKINGLILQPEEEFNFYKLVYDNKLREFRMGWVILSGREELAVGGGICGAATTAFEAAYRSGLQITERRAHSIFYRSFYSMEKIGLDAAVYGSRPNVRFVNNTGYPILLHVEYPQENVANFQVWGRKHFDQLTLEGPNLKGKSTRWVRTIWNKDGTVAVDELLSRFGKIH